jgi:hypothetical protein
MGDDRGVTGGRLGQCGLTASHREDASPSAGEGTSGGSTYA